MALKIVILGATGTTGAYAVEEALAAGHEVVAYVRNPASILPREGLRIIAGSVEDEAAMRVAFSSADAVVSFLGARVSAGVLFKGTDFQRRMLPKVIAAIDGARVRRFVLMSSFGVGDTARLGSLVPRLFFHRLIAGRLFDDKAVAERALASCKANWTAVYPVTLHSGPIDPAYDLVPLDDVRKVPGIPRLTFATVAKALVNLVPEMDFPRARLLLAPRKGWR
jgi:putative NADH-flavin reductase